MPREQFEKLYREYMEKNNYKYEEYDVNGEWRYYLRGRSWFAAWLDKQEKKL